jgi:nucleoid DNA-binding protein
MNTTAKRFFKYTWQDPKFSQLTPEEKLMYKYIWESSDIAGVHQVHKAIMSACLGLEISDKMIQSLIDKVEDFVLLEGDRVWISSFIRYQQAETKDSLSKNPPHKSAVRHLVKAGIFQDAVSLDPELFKEYISDSLPLTKPYSNSQSISTSSIPSSGNGSGHSPIQSISESSTTTYNYAVGIVDEYFNVSKNEAHTLVQEINQIIIELKGRNIPNPDEYLEFKVKELVEKWGRNDVSVELVRDTLGLNL